jgi:aminopeptidase-like protein
MTLTDEIDAFLRRLFPLARSITGEPNRQTLRTLQELIPLVIREIPSGTTVYDWTIPDEWNIRGAWIEDEHGRRIVDFAQNNLHVVSYSVPLDRRMSWPELAPHVHRHPELPQAIPYRTSYYRRDWGFCVTAAQYEELANARGLLRVVVNSELAPGSLSYGEYLLPGTSPQEILVSSYICHPSMANDSLSGVLLAAFLARSLASRPARQWSYRVVFVPETIGAIAYCAQNEAAMRAIDIGLVATTVGGPGKLGYKQSWNARHAVNRHIEAVFREAGRAYRTYPFDIHGSDERQYSTQGFRINCATIFKDRYYEYLEYHSSLDDLSLVTASQIAESLDIYLRLIDRLEARRIYRNCIRHGEVMLSRHQLYPASGGAQRPELDGRSELDLTLWLLFHCDGRQAVDDIALLLDVPPAALQPIVERLVEKGVLQRV